MIKFLSILTLAFLLSTSFCQADQDARALSTTNRTSIQKLTDYFKKNAGPSRSTNKMFDEHGNRVDQSAHKAGYKSNYPTNTNGTTRPRNSFDWF